jgi:hypothetical protein
MADTDGFGMKKKDEVYEGAAKKAGWGPSKKEREYQAPKKVGNEIHAKRVGNDMKNK